MNQTTRPHSLEKNLRVLVVDDNRTIHDDFQKILSADAAADALDDLESAIFGDAKQVASRADFELSFASQGQEALELVKQACAAGKPYAVVFMDVRMPPGWDGVETTAKLWEVDPDLQVVICTAYSDYSWEEMMGMLGNSDRVLILKKPFDSIEVLQFAHALSDKWALLQASRVNAEALESAVLDRTRDLEEANAQLEREVAERQKLLGELATARDAALESVRLKSQFLANMSHEIRTPMNGVVGVAELLLDTELTREQRELADMIRGSADLLLNIINDVLDFSKLESGKMNFETIDFDLLETLENTLDGMALRSHMRGLELIGHLHRNVPTKLKGDCNRLSQVFTNLVGNAVKFTAEGEVLVSVLLLSEDEDTVLLRFEIRDTGIGISPEAAARIFEPFIQADSSTTRRYGGTGLGLSICKQIVEGLGGTMGVESYPGGGATFWFTARFQKQAESRPERPVRPTAARVLVVDDNATHRGILRLLLENWGIDCVAVGDAEAALHLMQTEQAEENPFGIAIVDMQMPHMDGLTLADEIQKDPALKNVRVLGLGTMGHVPSPAILEAAGIREHLMKPVKQARLRAALTKLSEGLEVVSAGGERGESAPVPEKAEKKKSGLRILVAEDNVVNQKVALLQLSRMGYDAEVAENGLQVLEKLQIGWYDLIFMDCQMPLLDGYAATRRIRSEFDRPVTIVAMTANALAGDREKCLEAGMDDYISKPIRMPDIERVLKEYGPSDAADSV